MRIAHEQASNQQQLDLQQEVPYQGVQAVGRIGTGSRRRDTPDDNSQRQAEHHVGDTQALADFGTHGERDGQGEQTNHQQILDRDKLLERLDEEQAESARERFTDLVDSCESDEQLVCELNELSVELRRIIWFGSLSELATSYRDFAMSLRHYYWQQLGEEDEPDAAVEPEQWGELVEMLDDFLIEGSFH